ncbi:hypothetical protein CHLNCDRAFT_52345 [Chlorella variabilis]|uniref:SAP domain-containing protein n=1 Tax=Chlorella variabilis TaxID=554065 RepID=E1ZEN9_CHLVA|nr:hypothetical protein CHLNCDRAFT_52345 [Chlorella variabilis]EFN55528.1 hypothetical protein CHLNCDRAFT_52345 [Chlorella variabilis]|eukprot:XP_005847630.1 hypothetical protein CHLNCDRAFT_52345 [Chlorella variabilis]
MSHPGGTPATSTVRREVLSFRMVELTQVAERLGLKKTGRKGELQGRILAYFGEALPQSVVGRPEVQPPQQQWRIEHAAKVVHDTYCRMMGLPTNTPSDQSAHSSQQMPGGNAGAGPPPPQQGLPSAQAMQQARATLQQQQQQQQARATLQQQQQQQQAHATLQQQQQQQQAHATLQQQQRQGGAGAGRRPLPVRCICTSVAEQQGRMVMCQGKGCGVWQHTQCLGAGAPQGAAVDAFLCEGCRARLADPFWEATERLLPPAPLKPQLGRPPVVTMSGMQQVQSRDFVFYLHQQQLSAVQRDPENHRLQVGCLLVGDEVAERYHWPKHMDLKINNMPHRPYARSLNAKMGINQRDDVASIGTMVVRGRNTLSLSAPDSGTWVLMMHLARRRTMEQVKALMAAPEGLEEAVARVRRQVAGDDSDDDLLVSHQVVSLKDPMSGQRIQVPARFSGASGLQPFDLDSLLSMAQRSRKWQDPSTLQNSTVEQLQVDTYTQRVLLCLRGLPAITDIEISAGEQAGEGGGRKEAAEWCLTWAGRMAAAAWDPPAAPGRCYGQWRPDGSGREWIDIAADPADVAASLGAAVGAAGTKPEPEAAAGGGEPANGAGAGAAGAAGGSGQAFLVPDSDSEEEGAEEELRSAAAAVRKAPSAALSGQKHKADEPEVIDLLSSDEEEVPLLRRQQAQQQQRQQGQQGQQGPRPGPRAPMQQPQQQPQQQPGGPLRIRLPARVRPPAQPPPPAALPARQPSVDDDAMRGTYDWLHRTTAVQHAQAAVVQRAQAAAAMQQAQQLYGMQHYMQQQYMQQQAGPGGGLAVRPQLPPGYHPQQPWLPGTSFYPAPGATALPGFVPASQMMQMAGGGAAPAQAGAPDSSWQAQGEAARWQAQAAGQARQQAEKQAHLPAGQAHLAADEAHLQDQSALQELGYDAGWSSDADLAALFEDV